MERFSSSEDLSGEENRHRDLVPETQIPDSQRGLDLAFTPPLPPRSRQDVRAKADRGAIHKFDQSNVKRGEAMVTAMKEASQTVVRPYQAYNEKIDSMCSLFKLIEDLYRQHKLSGYASFWHLLDLKATKDEQAMNKVSSLHKDLPKTRQHWYTEDVQKMLQDTEGCRPVNDHGGVYDMSRMASQGLERSNTSGVRTSAASGTAGDDDDDLDLETSSPPPKHKKARSSEPPQNHEGPSTGVQRKTSSVGMDRLVSILEDMGHRDDTNMVDSIGGMSGSVKSMADAQHELNPYMFKALEGIAGLAQQEQAKAKESMLQESYSMLMKLEQDKDKMPLETYNKMVAHYNNNLNKLL
eukprot:gene6954-30930_t